MIWIELLQTLTRVMVYNSSTMTENKWGNILDFYLYITWLEAGVLKHKHTRYNMSSLHRCIQMGHFHWLAGGSSTSGSHGFHSDIFLDRASSHSAYTQDTQHSVTLTLSHEKQTVESSYHALHVGKYSNISDTHFCSSSIEQARGWLA